MKLLFVFTVLIAALTAPLFLAENAEDSRLEYKVGEYTSAGTDIFVLLGDEELAYSAFNDRLSIYQPDLVISSSDTSSKNEYFVDDLWVIVLSEDEFNCDIDLSKKSSISEMDDISYRLLVVDSPFWLNAGPSSCDDSFIKKTKDSFDAIIATDSNKVDFYEEDETVFFASTSPPGIDRAIRIRVDGQSVLVNNVSLQTEAGQSLEIDDGSIPVYRVNVDKEEFESLYKNAPFYSYGTDWQKMIEPSPVLDELQAPMDGTIILGDDQLEIELNNRGNVGNHWRDYKKSWDINFKDKSIRQKKLIIPSDRGYSEQIMARYISEAIGVPSPGIGIARLFINNIDFGTYLEYEDFDKAFIELNGYNSDALPSKNQFRDHMDSYPIINDLNFTSGDKQDKTYQQNLSLGSVTSDNFNNIFDREIFAKWVAVQVITADVHQNLADNFRYFIDRPTGRYIMVSWDVGINSVGSDYQSLNPLVQLFMLNSENKRMVAEEVSQFMSKYDEHIDSMLNIARNNLEYFSADPTLEITRSQLAGSLKITESTLINNKEPLLKWVESNEK